MRSYATIPPTVWQTEIKKLRGDAEAVAVYFHLITSPHSTMIGVYPLPMIYLAHDLGSPLEGASKGLRRVIEAGLCTYDEESEIVWVHEMAATQVAPRLSPKDNRVSAIAKQLAILPICPITLAFYRRYREPFHFQDQNCLDEFERAFRGAYQGASEPLRSKEQEQDKEQDKDLGQEQEQFGSGDERLAPARASSSQDPFEPCATVEEGKRFLISKGVPSARMETALQRLMKGKLFPCDIEEWKQEAQQERAA